jgi:GTP-binding protein Era
MWPRGFRSGVVALAGRANVGKSTLLNTMAGEKVSIVSDKPQTTRGLVRAVLTTPVAQAVFVDTPGLHKPRTPLGQRLNRTAVGAMDDIDLLVMVVDGRSGAGRGDRFVVEQLPRRQVCVVNKVDGMARPSVLAQLAAVADWGFEEYFAVSARTGKGVEDLMAHVLGRLPEGPPLYPLPETLLSAAAAAGGRVAERDMDDARWVAELVREQLLALARDELPYSIACRVTDWEWPYVKCEILVERPSQKGIVIGHAGSVLKQVGTAVRAQMPQGAYLDLSVKVARDWQRRTDVLDRMGI